MKKNSHTYVVRARNFELSFDRGYAIIMVKNIFTTTPRPTRFNVITNARQNCTLSNTYKYDLKLISIGHNVTHPAAADDLELRDSAAM